MEDKLISLMTAKLAKEVGFDIITKNWFYDFRAHSYEEYKEQSFFSDKEIIEIKAVCGKETNNRYYNHVENEYARPTQTLLQSWIRLIHGIAVVPTLDHDLNWIYKIISLNPCQILDGTIVSEHSYGSDYEICLEDGLFETLLIIKNNLPT